jgi:hypothetical protein
VSPAASGNNGVHRWATMKEGDCERFGARFREKLLDLPSAAR